MQHTDDVVDVPVELVVQVSHELVVAKTAEIPQSPSVKKIRVISETAELLSDVPVPQGRVMAQTVEISQTLFGEKIATIPEVLFHAGMKRITQQPVGCQYQQQDNQPQTARQSTRHKRERRGERGESEEEKKESL